MKAEIIAVGSELLTPDRVDTNSLFVTEELNKLGIEVLRKTIVGDNRELLAEAFRDALNRVPVVITSGGLGPTEDDLTRETVAELLGRRLQRNDEVVRAIEARFRSFKRDMPAVNLRQAMVPEGAEVLENPRGTAPGLWIEDKGRMVALLPGARVEAAVSRTGASALAPPCFGRSYVPPRTSRDRARRIACRGTHPADLHALSARQHNASRRPRLSP